jgi:hypothetical protein
LLDYSVYDALQGGFGKAMFNAAIFLEFYAIIGLRVPLVRTQFALRYMWG